MSSDEEAIRALITRWTEATRAGDVDTVLALMAPDAVFLMAGQPPMVGHEAFAGALRGVLTDHTVESTSEVDEIAVSGEMAYCRTRLTVTVTSRHGVFISSPPHHQTTRSPPTCMTNHHWP